MGWWLFLWNLPITFSEDGFLHIDCRIHKVYILPIQLLPQKFDSLAEPLEVDDFPFPQETDDVIDVRIITDAQNVVVSYPCLLL